MGNEVDSQGTELLQFEDKLFDAASEAIKSPDHNYVENAAAGVRHQCIQTGSRFLGPAEAVGIHPAQRPSSLGDQI
jgi:hypothetical protein